jgi:hypothetical protein
VARVHGAHHVLWPEILEDPGHDAFLYFSPTFLLPTGCICDSFFSSFFFFLRRRAPKKFSFLAPHTSHHAPSYSILSSIYEIQICLYPPLYLL